MLDGGEVSYHDRPRPSVGPPITSLAGVLQSEDNPISVIYSSDGAGLQLRTTPLTFEVTSDLAVSATCS